MLELHQTHPQSHSHPQRPIPMAMIIDDEPVDQMIFQRAVKRSGLVGDMIGFNNGQAALEYLADPANPKVDVLFLDVNMPGMTGLEFLDAATERFGPEFAGTCVVMLTTSLAPKDRAAAKRFDAVCDFVSKPLRANHLQDVAWMLAQQRSVSYTH